MPNLWIRPGRVVEPTTPPTRIVAYFRNSSQGNAVIQLLGTVGVPADGLGVTPPDLMPGGQGMLLAIPCRDEVTTRQVESICRSQGAELHRS